LHEVYAKRAVIGKVWLTKKLGTIRERDPLPAMEPRLAALKH
jgi:hypothetical protein